MAVSAPSTPITQLTPPRADDGQQQQHTPAALERNASATAVPTPRSASADVLPWQNAVSGAAAGVASRFVIAPLDIYSGFADAVKQIAAREGMSGFYRGVWPSVVQIIPYMALMFESQSVFRSFFSSARTSGVAVFGWWGSRTDEALAGGLAGIFSKTAIMPFDIIKKRLQVQGPDRNSYMLSDIPRYTSSGVLRVGQQIVRHEGILALYKGLLPTLLKTGPSSAVTFLVVGECRKQFAEFNKRARATASALGG
ncbi:mitochondrial thiamine pyrophosphate transporter [Cladochytrium tenue]|nr:mitochondrial thiamine pyrophosphate transporter [Cladochytrium tenue]